MNRHQHSWLKSGNRLQPVVIMDDWLGPVTALIKCDESGHYALIYLVCWQGSSLERRIFALRTVPQDIAQTYLVNISRDYCDLTRKQLESDALFSAAAPVTHLIATSNDLLVDNATTTELSPPMRHWRDINTDDYPSWAKEMLF